MIVLEIMEDKVHQLLTRAVHQIEKKEDLEKLLNSGKKLRVKFGIDPTAEHIHLGHSVPLLKLREFQDLGHEIIFLIGDFTATIGDPTGKSVTRPALTDEEVKANMKSYIDQAGMILDLDRTEIRHNSEWFRKMSLAEFYSLAKINTYSDLTNRSMVRERIENKESLTLSEMIYPVLQAYDSVMLKADIEIGGLDQIFNMLHGRKIQEKFNQPPQQVMTFELLIGLDGKDKMSKSLNNYIGLTEDPESQFGKIMSLPDELIFEYFALVTRLSQEEINSIKSLKPRDAKARLGWEIVKMYHGEAQATKAQDTFDRVISKGETPEDIKEFDLSGKTIIQASVSSGLVESNSEAKRLIEQKGIQVNGEAVEDWNYEVKSGDIIRKGHVFIKAK